MGLQSLYPSNGFVDELAWAAAWLYSASNSTASNYLSDARKYYAQAIAQQVGSIRTSHLHLGSELPCKHLILC